MAVSLLIVFSIIILGVQHIKRTTKKSQENPNDRKSIDTNVIYEEVSNSHGFIDTESNMAYATVKLN